MPIIKFTSNLKRFYPNLTDISLPEETIEQLIELVNNKYPGIKNYILDDQKVLRKHVNIFVNNKMLEDRKNLTIRITDNDELFFMQALSGG